MILSTMMTFQNMKENNRQKSKLRARIEHVFGYMSQSMKGFYLREAV